MNKIFNISDGINIVNGIFLAPMEGITDLPFRLICKELGADILYTEFVASEALVRDVEKSFRKIHLDDRERPVAVQIFGNNPHVMAQAALIAQEEGADFVDINYGCWVKKVVNNNAGSALMKSPELMAEITSQCVNAVKIPVTIKTRLGWNKENINICEIAKMQEEAGAKAITVHCRTRDMGISGKADWSYVPKIKEHITIPLVLNGDINSPETVAAAMQTEGVGAIMIGRAAVGNPFIFREAKQFMADNSFEKAAVRERMDVCLRHLRYTIEAKGGHGICEFRKHYSGYLRGMFGAATARQRLVVAENYDEICGIIDEYYQYLEANERLSLHENPEIPKVICRR